MRILKVLGFIAVSSLLAACGDTIEEEAATGGLAGFAVGGPVGAAVGAGVGATAPDPL